MNVLHLEISENEIIELMLSKYNKSKNRQTFITY